MTAQYHRRATWLAVLGMIWMLVLALAGVEHAVGYFLPALLLVAPLLVGRYPGGDALVRRLVAGSPSRRRRPVPQPVRGRTRERIFPRTGGALLAASLAGRAPPGF